MFAVLGFWFSGSLMAGKRPRPGLRTDDSEETGHYDRIVLNHFNHNYDFGRRSFRMAELYG